VLRGRFDLTPRARRVIAIAALVLLAGLARCRFDELTAPQVPRQFPDSTVYLQIAEQPFSFAHLAYPKPLLVPMVYRAVDAEPDAIVGVQRELAFASWTIFAIALIVCLRRWRARVLGAALAFTFLLAPYRVGWTGCVLSESIGDSLMALCAAAAIALVTAAHRLPPGRRRSLACGALAAATGALGGAWMLTRDTNAIIAIGAVVAAMWLWRPRWRRVPRWVIALAASTTLIGAIVIASTRVVPRQPTGLDLDAGWDAPTTTRSAFEVMNDIMVRVLPDPDATQFFVDHGMPYGPDIEALAGKFAGDASYHFMTDPQYHVARVWMARHGAGVWMRWLLRHPWQRTDDVVASMWSALAPRDVAAYMPHNWEPAESDGLLSGAMRRASASETLILLLVLVAPFTLRGGRAHGLTAIAAIAVASAIPAVAASYYGDAIEISRHCWGAGQQIVLGLFLGALGWLDRRDPARDDRHAPGAPAC
jgi:hypothetical protein